MHAREDRIISVTPTRTREETRDPDRGIKVCPCLSSLKPAPHFPQRLDEGSEQSPLFLSG
jgi:hypothetical protein